MADHPKLAWTQADLPPKLREVPEGAVLVAKAVYNARLLAGTKGDPITETLAELKKRKIT